MSSEQVKSKNADNTRGWMMIFTTLVPIGAGLAWGFGGLLFGIGLWCLAAIIGSDIEDAIKDSRR